MWLIRQRSYSVRWYSVSRDKVNSRRNESSVSIFLLFGYNIHNQVGEFSEMKNFVMVYAALTVDLKYCYRLRPRHVIWKSASHPHKLRLYCDWHWLRKNDYEIDGTFVHKWNVEMGISGNFWVFQGVFWEFLEISGYQSSSNLKVCQRCLCFYSNLPAHLLTLQNVTKFLIWDHVCYS